MAIGKKIGTLSSVFNLKSQISRYILMGLFEKVGAGSNDTNTKDLQEMFKYKIPSDRNSIMIQSLEDGRLKVSLDWFVKSKDPSAKIGGFLSGKEQFVLDYDTFDIFNSEY